MLHMPGMMYSETDVHQGSINHASKQVDKYPDYKHKHNYYMYIYIQIMPLIKSTSTQTASISAPVTGLERVAVRAESWRGGSG